MLAELGFKSLDEAIGRADVLSARTDVPLAKTNGMLDLDFITNLPDVSKDRCVCAGALALCGGHLSPLLLILLLSFWVLSSLQLLRNSEAAPQIFTFLRISLKPEEP